MGINTIFSDHIKQSLFGATGSILNTNKGAPSILQNYSVRGQLTPLPLLLIQLCIFLHLQYTIFTKCYFTNHIALDEALDICIIYIKGANFRHISKEDIQRNKINKNNFIKLRACDTFSVIC